MQHKDARTNRQYGVVVLMMATKRRWGSRLWISPLLLTMWQPLTTKHFES